MNLLSFLFFLSFSSFAASGESLQSYDLNQDGIKDRFEYSVAEKVIRVEEDRDGDKKIDFKTFLDDKTYFKVQWQYSEESGKLERKTSHLLLPENKTKIITEVDKDGDGVFEIRYEQVVSNIQKQDQCGEVNSTIRELSNTTLKAVAKNQKGLLPTGLGYKVDYECYQKWGDDFNKIVKEVAVGGLQCLMDLDKKGKSGTKTTGALRNAFDLTKLMKNDGISLVCSEDNYAWTGTMAHASVASTEVMEKKNIKHPFVSLNPKYPEHEGTGRAAEVAELKNTIFHETLHNLGYSHKEDIEFSYTCGMCCFDKNADATAKAQACKVCTGNYKNATDINYVKDLVEFAQLTFQNDRGAAATIKYLKENKSVSGLTILSYSTSGVFNPVGSELAKLISSKHKDLSVSDAIYLANAEKYSNQAEFLNVKTTSKTLSSSLYELYYNKSGAAAIALLEKNKAAIKQELSKAKKGSGNNPYVHDEIRTVLDNMIYEMWLNNYPDKQTSDQAYQLFEFFKNT